MRISVIGTVHEDLGHANSTELLVILLRTQPEVIFLEMPPSALGNYFGGTLSNLESVAVNQYRARHQVNLVPVDLPTPDAEFFSGLEEVRRSIRNRSVEYCRLVSRDEQAVLAHGFEYLNSAHYSELLADIHAARLSALAEIGDPRLAEIYEMFTSTNERRDEAMLRNIEMYCSGASFHEGVFLVGAAHRKSLFQMSSVHAGTESSPVQWDFVGSV